MLFGKPLLVLLCVTIAGIPISANAACKTADLAGKWDGTITEVTGYVGTYYCSNFEIRRNGKVVPNKGSCKGAGIDVEQETRKVEKLTVKITGGKVHLNKSCGIITSGRKASTLKLEQGKGVVDLKFSNGVYSKRAGTLIGVEHSKRGSVTWHWVKR